MCNTRNTLAWVLLAVMLLLCHPVRAADEADQPLGPEDVLVVANRYDRESMRVADHYMQAREIPEDQRLNVSVPIKSGLSRDRYNQFVRDHIRAYIIDRDLRDQIRCIVLSYNMPLRVSGPPAPEGTEGEDPSADRIRSAWREAVKETESELAAVDRLARNEDEKSADDSAPSAPTSEQNDPSPDVSLEQARALAERAGEAIQRAEQRIAALSDPSQRQSDAEQLLLRRVALAGLTGSWNALQSRIVAEGPPGRLREVYDQLHGTDLALGVLERSDRPAARREARRLRRQHTGLLGLVRQHAIDQLQLKSGARASLDSELSLLWWDDYPLTGRLPNTAAYPFDRVRSAVPEPPVLITARLHATDAATAIRMIDDAVAVEKTGLQGRVYLDARGLDKSDQSGDYDRSLIDLADRLRGTDPAEPRDLDVILDEQSDVMEPHSGENAALYCGWYAVRKFNDPLDFARGAVGFHIASFEATNFSEKSTAWVPNLLRAGCAVSLGPVAEPYLDAFPLPDDFFQLLLTGRHTVGEVFLKTTKYNSWMMTLCGDPLYNPFKNAPVLREDQVQLSRSIQQPLSDRAIQHARQLIQQTLGE